MRNWPRKNYALQGFTSKPCGVEIPVKNPGSGLEYTKPKPQDKDLLAQEQYFICGQFFGMYYQPLLGEVHDSPKQADYKDDGILF